MATQAPTQEGPEQTSGLGLIRGAGIAIILTALAAALLPLSPGIDGNTLIGAMMMVAGVIEALAGTLRPTDRAATIVPGIITLVAGACFLFEPFGAFVPQVRLLTAWLVARAMVLGLVGFLTAGSLRFWTFTAAVTDGLLGAVLFSGLSATTMTIALFGPTPDVIAGFAWVLGASFLASGLLLMVIGRSAIDPGLRTIA